MNREVIEALVDSHNDFFGNYRPVFDGRKNLYTRKPLSIGRERVRIFIHFRVLKFQSAFVIFDFTYPGCMYYV